MESKRLAVKPGHFRAHSAAFSDGHFYQDEHIFAAEPRHIHMIFLFVCYFYISRLIIGRVPTENSDQSFNGASMKGNCFMCFTPPTLGGSSRSK